MTLTLIINGMVYVPEPKGKIAVLIANDRIAHVGVLGVENLTAFGLECEVIDAAGCVVLPGLIDPHEHLIGAGGEDGFRSRMPEVPVSALLMAGITTVIGLLGTDTSTRRLECLHAKVCQLWEENLTAYMYTGGFELPPRTLTASILEDMVMIDKIIGAGEIALSDERWLDPTLHDLALTVKSTMLGGMMSGKAGVAHFHMGDGEKRFALLEALLDEFKFPPECIYPTHITRTPELLQGAIKLAERGCYVDMDTTEQNLGECLRKYHEMGGRFDRLTVSSDAHTTSGSPARHFQQFCSAILEHGFTVEEILPLFSRNPANVLKLKGKGVIEPGSDADIVILNEDTLDVVHVIGRGNQLVKDGAIAAEIKQEQTLEALKR